MSALPSKAEKVPSEASRSRSPPRDVKRDWWIMKNMNKSFIVHYLSLWLCLKYFSLWSWGWFYRMQINILSVFETGSSWSICDVFSFPAVVFRRSYVSWLWKGQVVIVLFAVAVSLFGLGSDLLWFFSLGFLWLKVLLHNWWFFPFTQHSLVGAANFWTQFWTSWAAFTFFGGSLIGFEVTGSFIGGMLGSKTRSFGIGLETWPIGSLFNHFFLGLFKLSPHVVVIIQLGQIFIVLEMLFLERFPDIGLQFIEIGLSSIVKAIPSRGGAFFWVASGAVLDLILLISTKE